MAEFNQESQRGEQFDLFVDSHMLVFLCNLTLALLAPFPGCHVAPGPSEKAQHHSLHHRQRPPAGLVQWQGPRLTEALRRHPTSVTGHRAGRFFQGEKPQPRYVMIDIILKGTVVTIFCDHLPHVTDRQCKVAAQLLSGAPSSRVRLSSPWEQQRRPGGEGRVSADGRGGGLFRSGLPQLLPFLAPGWQSPWGVPRHERLLWVPAGRFLPRLQPGCRLAAHEQLRLWGRLWLWRVWLWRICVLVNKTDLLIL